LVKRSSWEPLSQYYEPIPKRPISKSALICPISASGSNFNPRNTTCIHPKGIYYAAPVVKIFTFLDIEQISVDFGLKRFETGSYRKIYFNHNAVNNTKYIFMLA